MIVSKAEGSTNPAPERIAEVTQKMRDQFDPRIHSHAHEGNIVFLLPVPLSTLPIHQQIAAFSSLHDDVSFDQVPAALDLCWQPEGLIGLTPSWTISGLQWRIERLTKRVAGGEPELGFVLGGLSRFWAIARGNESNQPILQIGMDETLDTDTVCNVASVLAGLLQLSFELIVRGHVVAVSPRDDHCNIFTRIPAALQVNNEK